MERSIFLQKVLKAVETKRANAEAEEVENIKNKINELKKNISQKEISSHQLQVNYPLELQIENKTKNVELQLEVVYLRGSNLFIFILFNRGNDVAQTTTATKR